MIINGSIIKLVYLARYVRPTRNPTLKSVFKFIMAMILSLRLIYSSNKSVVNIPIVWLKSDVADSMPTPLVKNKIPDQKATSLLNKLSRSIRYRIRVVKYNIKEYILIAKRELPKNKNNEKKYGSKGESWYAGLVVS